MCALQSTDVLLEFCKLWHELVVPAEADMLKSLESGAQNKHYLLNLLSPYSLPSHLNVISTSRRPANHRIRINQRQRRPKEKGQKERPAPASGQDHEHTFARHRSFKGLCRSSQGGRGVRNGFVSRNIMFSIWHSVLDVGINHHMIELGIFVYLGFTCQVTCTPCRILLK